MAKFCALTLALCIQCLLFIPTAQAAPAKPLLPPRPKLIVVMVIDQFRADYLLRFEKRFLPAKDAKGQVGGFSYLMSQGAYFPMAEYTLLQSMTCPGHATILTGAMPYQMGIPINYWQDTQKDQLVYCAEDSEFSTVGAPDFPHAGTSPKNLIASTVGDELKNAGFPSRVVTVALKDRAAIMLGGHRADLAFWMNNKTHGWVSSNYYLPDKKLPAWLEKLNADIKKDATNRKIKWEAIGPGTGYSEESPRTINDAEDIGTHFPHEVLASAKAALALPYGMELTETAAERALDAYRLGQGQSTDLLAMSFSSHDYISHAFGVNSREMEEMTLSEDRLISKFLNHLRTTLPGGLKDVTLVLTGDHGTPPNPDYLKPKHIDAGRIIENDLTAALEKLLNKKFGTPSDGLKWISSNHDLAIYVNRQAVASRKVALAAVLDEIKAHVLKIHGIAHAFTVFDHANRKIPPGLHEQQILQGYFPGRSGDVMMIPLPNYMVDGDTVTHLTGYNYDRMVPLIISGPRIRAGNYPQHVRVIDLAPTLSYLAGTIPPSLSEGRVLSEIIADAPGNSR
ncbi:alkaline phosphatase family protein [Bdellovibrionota bacterium FG-1]